MRWLGSVLALVICLVVCLLVVAIRSRTMVLRKLTCDVQQQTAGLQAEAGFYKMKKARVLRKAVLEQSLIRLRSRSED